MRNKNAWMLVMLFAMLSLPVFSATMIFNCNVGGAKLQFYNDNTRDWNAPIPFPQTKVVPQYTYLIVKVTAPGYEDFEQGFEAKLYGMNDFLVTLTPDNYTPTTVALFGCEGHIISRRGLSILPNTYKVVMRNLSTYKKTDAAQISQDIVYNGTDGHFSCCLANLFTNRAVAVGDKVFIGVFNTTLTRCYGHVTKTMTEDTVANAGMLAKIFIQ